MKVSTLAVAAAVFLLLNVAAFSQTVTVTPRKTVYRRQKPIADHKKTFTIRRPVAKASTPALSRSITSAISPEKILDINLKEELGESQWLEEADYSVTYNRNNILCLNLWMTGTAAYPDSVERYVTISTADAHRIKAAEIFANLPALAAKVRKIQQAEVARASAEIKKDPESSDVDPAQLFESTKFTVRDLDSFFIDEKGVTFVYDYGFPHVIKALEPEGKYLLTWDELRPYIRRGGLLAKFVR